MTDLIKIFTLLQLEPIMTKYLNKGSWIFIHARKRERDWEREREREREGKNSLSNDRIHSHKIFSSLFDWHFGMSKSVSFYPNLNQQSQSSASALLTIHFWGSQILNPIDDQRKPVRHWLLRGLFTLTKVSFLGGSLCTYLLLPQWPRVRFSAFPRFFQRKFLMK